MTARTVGIGVIGAGGIARRKTIPSMLKTDNCRLAAVMDPVDVDRIAAEFHVSKAYDNVLELLDDPEVEAVYIASPVGCHAEQIALAAEAGKHILCEKPLTPTLAETRRAIDICRKQKVFLQEGYMMKFHGAHRMIKEHIDAGRLGKIVSMRAQLSCWYPPIEGAWRQDPTQGGGGAMIDMATHLYDLLMDFAGPVRRVAAMTGNLVHSYASEDASTTLLELGSGTQATVDCFYCIPDEASRSRLEVYGSAGAILAEGTLGQGSGGTVEGIFGVGESPYDADQHRDTVPQFQRLAFEVIDPYMAECEYFSDCILNDRKPVINGPQNALHIATLTEKAYASTE